MDTLEKSAKISLYKINKNTFIASTPETRAIANDSLLLGVRYTEALKKASVSLFSSKTFAEVIPFSEQQTCILHILRGGLNFGLREALFEARGWYRHSSAFVSAQRKQDAANPDRWYITENSYAKLDCPNQGVFIFADVVATGTSLRFGLERLLQNCIENKAPIQRIIFLTIGSAETERIFEDFSKRCRAAFPDFIDATVVYFEGRFGVPVADTSLRIKLTGTDLLRGTDALVAPEFIESQYESPSYPLERCTIYDAGSRAFAVSEYLEDVAHYWKAVMQLANDGLSFESYLNERFPELDAKRFDSVTLKDCAKKMISKITALENFSG